jgi:hypothetical protein
MSPSAEIVMMDATSTFVSARAAGRIEGLEALLSRLRRCPSPAQAENLVAYAIPELVDAIWATLYLSDDGLPPVVYGDDMWQHLADAAIARRMPCATRRDGIVTTAIPIFSGTGVAGVLVMASPGELSEHDQRTLRLFAARAGRAVRRPGLPVSA